MTQGIIDETVFRELCESAGTDFANDLVATFADESPSIVARLHAAREAGEAEDFRRAAHSLKSNALIFGASRLAELARELERGGLPVEAARAEALETALKEALRALEGLGRG